MDVSFIISTLVNLVVDRKTKWIYVNIFSILMIIVAVAMKLFAIAYPIWSLVFWYFYIWFVYGIQISCNKKRNRMKRITIKRSNGVWFSWYRESTGKQDKT